MCTCCLCIASEKLPVYAYQRRDSQQTLSQALQEYHAVHPGLSQACNMSPQAAFFLRCHDTVHVVFGCGVDLDDEAVVKLARLLGTKASLGSLRGKVLRKSLEDCGQLRVIDVLRAIRGQFGITVANPAPRRGC